METANFYILAKPLQSVQGPKDRLQVVTRRPSLTRSKAETEPETRLWKVCAKAVSPRLSRFERIAFLLFVASALVALAFCFSESFHLFNSGALDKTVRVVLTR